MKKPTLLVLLAAAGCSDFSRYETASEECQHLLERANISNAFVIVSREDMFGYVRSCQAMGEKRQRAWVEHGEALRREDFTVSKPRPELRHLRAEAERYAALESKACEDAREAATDYAHNLEHADMDRKALTACWERTWSGAR